MSFTITCTAKKTHDFFRRPPQSLFPATFDPRSARWTASSPHRAGAAACNPVPGSGCRIHLDALSRPAGQGDHHKQSLRRPTRRNPSFIWRKYAGTFLPCPGKRAAIPPGFVVWWATVWISLSFYLLGWANRLSASTPNLFLLTFPHIFSKQR